MKTQNQSGFTLIEALVAMVILTVGILSLYAMQTTAITGNVTASRLSVATAVATDCYERLWNTPYDHPLLSDTGGATAHTQADFKEFDGFKTFTLPHGVTGVSWGVTTWLDNDDTDNDQDGDKDEDDETGIKAVTLNVNYSDKNIAKTVTITFYKI